MYQFGGLYVDTDVECFKAFDILHHYYDFFVGTEPFSTGRITIETTVIGSIAWHPILKHCIESMKDNWRVPISDKHFRRFIRSGIIHFTKSIWLMAGSGTTIDIVLPPICFYPLGCGRKYSAKNGICYPETFSAHYADMT